MTSQFKSDSKCVGFVVLSCIWSPTAANDQGAPDALNPMVTVDTLGTTICRTHSSKSIRPPGVYHCGRKRANAAAYGYTESLCRHQVCPYCSSDRSAARRCGTGS
jgi:hypothetical protein